MRMTKVPGNIVQFLKNVLGVALQIPPPQYEVISSSLKMHVNVCFSGWGGGGEEVP